MLELDKWIIFITNIFQFILCIEFVTILTLIFLIYKIENRNKLNRAINEYKEIINSSIK